MNIKWRIAPEKMESRETGFFECPDMTSLENMIILQTPRIWPNNCETQVEGLKAYTNDGPSKRHILAAISAAFDKRMQKIFPGMEFEIGDCEVFVREI